MSAITSRRDQKKDDRFYRYAVAMGSPQVTPPMAANFMTFVAATPTSNGSISNVRVVYANVTVERQENFKAEMVRRLVRLKKEKPAKVFKDDNALMDWLDAIR